jgi:sugar fermentation stimulation protein A
LKIFENSKKLVVCLYLMRIRNLVEGKLNRRLNRFVVEVYREGKKALAHLRDPGRLEELMTPGNRVLMREKTSGKTQFELFAIYHGKIPVVVNSSIHNKLAEEILMGEGFRVVDREVRINGHRIDLLIDSEGREVLVEVKGCTLVRNGVALFPDAPTTRGLAHIRLIMREKGMILFLVMRGDAQRFSPNYRTHREFALELENAARQGVEIRAARMNVQILESEKEAKKDLEINFDRYLPVCFCNQDVNQEPTRESPHQATFE